MSDKSPPPVAALPTRGRHVVVPHAAWGDERLRPVLATLPLPALQALLSRLTPEAPDAAADTAAEESLSPPHERALARALGLPTADGLIPWAARAALAQGLAGHTPGWAVVTPCRWQVGMNEVQQDNPAGLIESAEESQAFMAALAPWFAEDGITLHAGPDACAWLAHGAIFDGLPTASLARVIGRDIDTWNLGGPAARPLRRLQQEMQMLLYTHPLNDAREARGRPGINSFWLSGTGRLPDDWRGDPPAPPETLDTLSAAYLRGDGHDWIEAWKALDAQLAADLLPAVRRGDAITLTLCGERACQRWHSGGTGLLARLARRLRPVRPAAVLEKL